MKITFDFEKMSPSVLSPTLAMVGFAVAVAVAEGVVVAGRVVVAEGVVVVAEGVVVVVVAGLVAADVAVVTGVVVVFDGLVVFIYMVYITTSYFFFYKINNMT